MYDLKYEVLVIGLGNVLMGDDGLGVYVAAGLQEKKWPPGVLILDVGTSTFNYLEEISQSRILIAVDAIQAGGKPGCIYRFGCSDNVNRPDNWRDAHGFSLLDTVELARRINGYPVNFIIYGVEPLDINFSNSLSQAVKKSLVKVIDKVSEEIHYFLINNSV